MAVTVPEPLNRPVAMTLTQGLVFVHGSGKRKTSFQRVFEELDSYIMRVKEYHRKVHICGKRNSSAKTDCDATFMRMKEDAMKNGQLKPAYNIQYGVDAEFVTWVGVYPNHTDTMTLIPFLEDYYRCTGKRYRNLIVDAGYESEENYLYLRNHGQLSYIKPNNYEIAKTRRFKNDIDCRENMTYLEDEDAYRCAAGKKLAVTTMRRRKSKTEYVKSKTVYPCESCDDCKLKTNCIHGHNSRIPLEERTKTLWVSKEMIKERADNLTRIKSEHITKNKLKYSSGRSLCRGKS